MIVGPLHHASHGPPPPLRGGGIPRPALALRFALRELRGGLRGFGVFIACIALGVAAIAGVASVARGMTEGIAREGQVILGGDINFTLTQRQAGAEKRAWLAKPGPVSAVATPPPTAPPAAPTYP